MKLEDALEMVMKGTMERNDYVLCRIGLFHCVFCLGFVLFLGFFWSQKPSAISGESIKLNV